MIAQLQNSVGINTKRQGPSLKRCWSQDGRGADDCSDDTASSCSSSQHPSKLARHCTLHTEAGQCQQDLAAAQPEHCGSATAAAAQAGVQHSSRKQQLLHLLHLVRCRRQPGGQQRVPLLLLLHRARQLNLMSAEQHQRAINQLLATQLPNVLRQAQASLCRGLLVLSLVSYVMMAAGGPPVLPERVIAAAEAALDATSASLGEARAMVLQLQYLQQAAVLHTQARQQQAFGCEEDELQDTSSSTD